MKYAVVMYSDPDAVRLTRTVEVADGSIDAIEKAVAIAVLLVESEGEYDRTGIVIADVIGQDLRGCDLSDTVSFASDWPIEDMLNEA